jgi:hypothetical protein
MGLEREKQKRRGGGGREKKKHTRKIKFYIPVKPCSHVKYN